MTGVVVGASSESIYAIKLAQNMGCQVIAFDGDENAEGLKYADYSYVLDIRSPELIIEKLGSKHPDIILPVPIGRYLTSSGYLNDYYNLKGLSEVSSTLCTDKYLFHKTLSECGLRPIDCTLLEHGAALSNNKEFSFPIILKPRYGSGSRGVKVFENQQLLSNDYINDCHPFNEDYLAESCFDGTEYGVDGAIIENQFHLILLRRKKLTSYPYRQCTAYMTVDNTYENKDLLLCVTQYITDVTQALKMNNCVLHADIIVNKDMQVFAIEVSGRPSGHQLHNLFTKMATGIDMIEQYIRFVNGQQYDFIPKNIRKMAIHYFDFQDCFINEIPEKSEICKNPNVLKYVCNITRGFLSKVTDGHSIMNRGYFIVTGQDDKETSDTYKFIVDKFKKEEVK